MCVMWCNSCSQGLGGTLHAVGKRQCQCDLGSHGLEHTRGMRTANVSTCLGVFQRPLTLMLLQKYRESLIHMGGAFSYQWVLYTLLTTSTRVCLCNSIVTRWEVCGCNLQKHCGHAGVDVTLLNFFQLLYFRRCFHF